MKIKEFIVVEGKDDTRAIQNAVDADTIETNGSAVSLETIEQIKLAQEVRGVIILTDPDYPGEKIRKYIADHIPNCKHAFIPKKFAIAKKGKGLGVEHASSEIIRQALADAQWMDDSYAEEITREDLLTAGLIGGEMAKERRERLGEILKIGYANGKQLHKRLRTFQIKKQDFITALQTVLQEEKV